MSVESFNHLPSYYRYLLHKSLPNKDAVTFILNPYYAPYDPDLASISMILLSPDELKRQEWAKKTAAEMFPLNKSRYWSGADLYFLPASNILYSIAEFQAVCHILPFYKHHPVYADLLKILEFFKLYVIDGE